VVTGVTAEKLAECFPRLFHMAGLGSWPSIKQHGLLSTSALLDLFEVPDSLRVDLESLHRPESVRISHPLHGRAVVRDQKPMDDKGLLRCLQDGLTPGEWYQILNDKVFFWLTEERLERLLRARAYRDQRHTVLQLDTARLLARHEGNVVLSPMNSGCTKPFPFPRGSRTFSPMREYPFDETSKKRGRRNAVVELAVVRGVPDVADFVLRVEERGAGKAARTIWKP
jgi:hypothetical protein